jgi:hypothetical protein
MSTRYIIIRQSMSNSHKGSFMLSLPERKVGLLVSQQAHFLLIC